MTVTTAPPTTAAETLMALRALIRGLDRVKLPVDEAKTAAWREAQLAPRHVAALMQVVADEGLSVTTLAGRLGVSLATASQVVTDLETHGIVVRVEDPTDRRRTLVRVSESRREMADTLLAARLRPIQRALDQLTPDTQRALIQSLNLITHELGETTDV